MAINNSDIKCILTAVQVPDKITLEFLNTFIKLRRATLIFVMPVCLRVTVGLPLDGLP